jgi:hypothetical protein
MENQVGLDANIQRRVYPSKARRPRWFCFVTFAPFVVESD